ncbi:Beauvericin cluster-specific repressor BEA4 [Colletotrichum sidae]|uniref:Beauvericin cluster-specific repressor BEA4 n=1 Tax=Colletotrichum sidae TaxID=1347389 RepID=A0A4R8TCY7_9PEZI|nr:Beauvericin cluster-specific repressor BEA4 [Colletotrichum sidae]
MPNTGKPRPNCHLCRQRRVKCDLERPRCQRCIKYGVRCPGYRDEQDLRFQNANLDSFEKRKRKKQMQNPGADPKELRVLAFTPESSASPAAEVSNLLSAPLLQVIRQHWSAESIPFVLSCYLSIGFLPTLFEGARDDHCLVKTCQVFSRAYVINRFRPDTGHRELSTCLGEALSSVSAALSSPKSHTSDATIVAVWLLGNYELLMGGIERKSFTSRPGDSSSSTSSWDVHSKGLLSLLRARGDRQLFTRPGRQIFWTMFTIVGDREAACACYDELVQGCDNAELTMLEWVRSAPEYQTGAGPVWQYFWNAWRTVRMKLHHMMILLTNLVEHSADSPFQPEALRERRQLCRGIIASTAQEVVGSIPKSLGGSMPDVDSTTPSAYFDACRVIWPLSHLYVVPTAPRHLRIVARDALFRIGREKGILTALKPRPGRGRFPPETLAGLPTDDLEGREVDSTSIPSWTEVESVQVRQ